MRIEDAPPTFQQRIYSRKDRLHSEIKNSQLFSTDDWRSVSLQFVGMDVVEVAPPYDVAEITALAAATIVWEYLVSPRPNGLINAQPFAMHPESGPIVLD